MKHPLYVEALKEGWAIAWRHKILWMFGLFATFLGQLGILEILSNVTFVTSATGDGHPRWFFIPRLLDTIFFISSPASLEWWTWLAWVLVVIVSFGLLLLFLSVVSQGALIACAAQFAKNEKVPNTTKAWHTGVDHFWRLLFLNVLKKLILALMALAVGQATLRIIFLPQVPAMDLLLFIFIFILVVAIGMAISFLTVYAAGYIVVENYQTLPAIRAAWKLFLTHKLVSMEVGSIVLLLNAGIAIVAILAMGVFLVSAKVWQVLAIVTSQFWLFDIVFTLGFVAALLFLVLLGSTFTVFTTTVWTHLFMKMHKHGLISKIVHWMR